MADITNAFEEWKPTGTLYLNYLKNHQSLIKYVNYINVCLVERNNLLIECFTDGYLDLEL